MTIFSYKATDPHGKIVQDTLEASDEKAAVTSIQAMGYIPIRVSTGGRKAGLLNFDVSSALGTLFSRISGRDIMFFTQDLATLLEAGLPVDRALSIQIDVTEKEVFREVIRDILNIVRGGGGLSDALAKYPKVFSDFYVNMVRAGEAGGILESVLKRLGLFLETSQDLKDYIKSALVYPVFLLSVGGISIVILMTYVIPRFSVIFADLGTGIPLSTKMLLSLSDLLRSYWWLILIAAIAVVVGFRRYIGTTNGRTTIDKIKLKLPISRDFVKKLEVARFTRTLGTLMESGVPILNSIRLVKDIIGNHVIRNALDHVHDSVKEGDKISRALETSDIFPRLAIQMIIVGEETGHLDEMMLKVADNYEKTIKNNVKRFISFLEPAMILVMGIVVAFIVISMLMAIFSMNEIPF